MAQNTPQRPSSPAGAAPSAASAQPKRYPVASLATSAEGERLIKRAEGLPGSEAPALKTYLDVAGHPTIGWGHRLSRGDDYPHGISPQQAQELFDADRKRHEDIVRRAVKVPLAQHEFDALMSLAYNIPDALASNYKERGRPTTLLERLNAGDYERAAQQFPVWNKIGKNGGYEPVDGLTRRREREQVIFRGGPYQGP